MRKPDGWWGHLPVFNGGRSVLGKYREWHERQLAEALKLATDKYANELKVIPESGFFVEAYRTIDRVSVGNDHLDICVYIFEDFNTRIGPKNISLRSVAGRGITEGLDRLGTDQNSFVGLFEGVAEILFPRWSQYVKWRRRIRVRPVPEWLTKLRAEERKPKRRNRPAGD